MGFLTLLGAISVLNAQDPEAQLIILPDAIDLGRPFPVKFEIIHPSDMVVIFPDSTDDFGEFELESIQSFPTQSGDGTSIDHVVYQLWSFQIAPMQGLQLPFRYITNGDTFSGLSNVDSIRMEQRVKIYSDTLSFRKHQGLTHVQEPKTFLIIMIGLVVFILLVLIFLAVLFLRGPILKKIHQWRVEKEWKLVQQQMQNCKSLLGDQIQYIERLNDIWKAYLTPVWNQSLKSLATPEMEQLMEASPKDLDQEEIDVLNHTNRLTDTILYAERGGSPAELETLLTDISGILAREYERRKGGTT